MKKLLFLFLGAISFATLSKAQSSALNPNEEAVRKLDATAGHFMYSLNDREKVNVNYSLKPLHPVDVAHFMVHTPDAMPFWATISNQSGKVVYTWKPENKVYLYNADWNVSKLKSGEYTVSIYVGADKQSAFQFKFTKQ